MENPNIETNQDIRSSSSTNLPANQVDQLLTTQPVSTPQKPRTHLRLLLVISAFFLVLLAGYALGKQPTKMQQFAASDSPSSNQPTPSPSPEVAADPMADWKTYTNTSSNYQLRYPSDWKIEGQTAGSFGNQQPANATYIEVFKPQSDPTKSLGNMGFEEVGTLLPAQAALLTQEKTINGQTFKCQGSEGSNNKLWCWIKVPDQNKYLSVHIFTNTDEEVNKTFNQIFSTFKFTTSTTKAKFTLDEIGQACIAIRNSSKFWNAKYQECNGAGDDQKPLKDFCDKYGGTFTPNGDSCRHAQAEGTPCGPEAEFYCSFKLIE